MLKKYEGRDWEQLFVGGADFPQLVKLKQNKEYIRNVIKDVRLTGNFEDTVPLDTVSDNHEFFKYQRQVNSSVEKVASHNVITKYIKKSGEDYRYEDKPSVEKTLRDRSVDNTELARKKGK